jgi:hypothetical protein
VWRKKAQFNWIIKFSEALRNEISGVDFAISGMDELDPKLPDWISDYRYPKHDDETMRRVCQRYADSHLIIGCNGSSLVLPCCHSGAAIDIVPGEAWSVSAGSFAFRATTISETHYRYALVPPEITIPRLINIAVSIIRDRALIELHTNTPWRDHDSNLEPFALSQYRIEAFEITKLFENTSGSVTVMRNKIES